MPDTMTLEEFRTMCERHDLTHMYSDDGGSYRAGRDSLARVQEAAKQFSREDAVRVWNEVVDTKMAEGYREQFYWEV